jgi:ABC-2 type transport system ATP-binding protein
MDIIKLTNVTKAFRGYTVIDDVSLSLSAGRIYGLVGANGSGKSVLMKIICGFIRPDRGEVFVSGKKIGNEIDFPDDIGIIIEEPGFIPTFSARKNLRLYAAYKHRINKDQIDSIIKFVGLDPKSRKAVGKYSLGMKQRLGIAQAIMEDPSLLLLDEPFNGLDKKGVSEMRSLLLELSSRGKTIILASHNADDIDFLCGEVYEMDAGRLNVK